jgi:hypothetical protein
VANIGGSQTDEFGAGVSHQVNDAGHVNAFTLGDAAQTDMSVEFGQQAVGNRDDAPMAEQSMTRAMMTGAAGIGTDDDVS